MGGVIEVGKFVKCTICNKRQATILCDMPIGSYKTLHMPKLEDSFKEGTLTCDRQVCDKCIKKVSHDRHICKKCIKNLNE